MKKILLSVIVIISSFSISKACSCAGEISFCEINYDNPTWHVFIGKIILHDSLYSDFEVIEKLRGIETKDTIRVWDNPSTSNSCVGVYETDTKFLGSVGDSILITLPKIDSIINWGIIGDYYRPLGICAKPFLPIKNQKIIGNLTYSYVYALPATPYVIDSIPIQTFTNNYNTTGRKDDCDLFVGISEFDVKPNTITLSPNPTNGLVFILGKEQVKYIEIFALNGKLIEIKDNVQNQIDFSKYLSGIYFVKIQLENENIVTKKVIVK